MEEIKLGLSYDDILLVPRLSDIVSRKDVNTSAQLTKKLRINLPLVSANMDTVTESAMAIALAREGGIGIIHRFMTIENQIKEVLKVKRSESIIIEQPYTLSGSKTLAEARAFMEQHAVTGLIVTDYENKVEGILTSRDLQFESNNNKLVKDTMTPRQYLITAPTTISLEEAKETLHKYRLEKLPLVDASGRLQGLITAKDIIRREKKPMATKDAKGRLMVGAAIGVKGDYLQRTEKLIEADADVVVVDIAHGHSVNAIKTIREVKEQFNIEVIAGNVATAEATEDLIAAGADAIKVGVGPGSACTTRIITGSGVPQVTAIMESAKAARNANIPLIADGGIKAAGDITKAIAAGASTVMVGNLLGGTDESPGFTRVKDGKKYKIYRGMASFDANLIRKEKEQTDLDLNDFVPEGVEAIIPYRGSATEVLKHLVGGLRSGMSYCGAHTIEELQQKVQFIRITSAGLKESHPHDLNQL